MFTSAVKYLTFRSLEDNTAEGRAKERYRLAALGSLANLISSASGMLVLIVTVPLTLQYLGDERFGAWMAISSLAGLLSFLDFGIANGLINRVATAKADRNLDELRFVVSHGLLVLLIIGIAMGGGLHFLSKFLPIQAVIRAEDLATIKEAEEAVSVFCLIFAASIPLGGLQRVLQGLQLSWIVHAVKTGAAILSLLVVVILSRCQADIPALLLGTYGVQTFAFLCLIVYLANRRLLAIPRAQPSQWRRQTVDLLSIGGLFFLLQIGYLVGWSSDFLIISSILGPAEVTPLAIAQRLFQLVFLPVSILNAVFWSAYADASARGDHTFIFRTLRVATFRSTLLAAVGCLSLALASPAILKIWIGSADSVSLGLAATYGLWIFIQCAFMPLSVLLNGLGIVREQVVLVVAFCAVCLPLKLYLTSSFGVIGVVQASVIAYVLTTAIPYIVIASSGLLRRRLALKGLCR